MPNYQQGKIYTIRCRTDDTMIYVGSTTQPLCERLAQHKRGSKNEKEINRLIYKSINDDWDNWYIELHSLCPCSCKEELCRREGEVIREIGNLNMEIAGRTRKEFSIDYYETNKEKLLLHQKKYNENHKEEIAIRKKHHYEANKEDILLSQKKNYEAKREKKLLQKKEYYIRKKAEKLNPTTNIT